MPPISPAVNAYMQQGQMQQGPSSAEAIFNNAFTTQAQNTMQAKYPSLSTAVVTFKVMDSDVNKGNAFGVFILRYRDGVRHIPAVMVGGNMKSCEMVYDRESDQFMPLTENVVNELANAAMITGTTLMDGDAKVENTTGLFRNLVRPPYSSNVALASSIDISDLPDNAKDTLYNYLLDKPNLLAKVAEFYPVDELGEKLAHNTKTASYADFALPEVLSIENLTKEAATFLTDEEKNHVKSYGYVVKNAEEAQNGVVANSDNNVVEALGIEEIGLNDDRFDGGHYKGAVQKGEALCYDGGEFKFEPILVVGNKVVFKSGDSIQLSKQTHLVVRGLSFEMDEDDLKEFSISTKLQKPAGKDGSITGCVLLTPTRYGYSAITLPGYIDKNKIMRTESQDGVASLRFGQHIVTQAPDITYGSVCTKEGQHFVPVGTGILFTYDYMETGSRIPSVVHTINDFVHLMSRFATPVSVASDGVSIAITDKKLNKTAQFNTAGDAAQYLVDKYNVSASGVDTILGNSQSFVFSKVAFGEGDPMAMQQQMMMQQQPVAGQQMPMQAVDNTQMQVPAQQPLMQAAAQGQQFNPQMVQDAVNLQDPQMFEAGALASFAQEPDVKSMLVDYLPDFTNVLDKLGRSILLFNIDYENMEEFYGKEKLETILGSMRRVFKIIGDLVYDLKKFINM